MASESEKTQGQIYREFDERKRKVRRFGYIFLSSFAVLGVAYVLATNSSFRPWIFGVGVATLLMFGVIGNREWSCPACGELFRKCGLRIRFCPHCGVQLVDNSERYQPAGVNETRAQEDSDGKPDTIAS